jgi:hypothetical protein
MFFQKILDARTALFFCSIADAEKAARKDAVRTQKGMGSFS